MIYDEIETSISKFLIEDFDLDQEEILTENEVPDDDLPFFVRQVWTYGTMNEVNNSDVRELAILNLEVYERKNDAVNKILDFIRDIRFYISKNMSMFYSQTDGYAKLYGIYIIKNTNEDDWLSYTVGIRFYIYKER